MPAQGARTRGVARAAAAAAHPSATALFLTLPRVQDAAPPSGELLASINKDFGSLDALVKKFSTAAVSVQGSGWAVRPRDNKETLQWQRLSSRHSLALRLHPCSRGAHAARRAAAQWLGYNKESGALAVGATANQDPCSTLGMVPLLGVDVWEHAYYLQYKNVRPDYVKAVWEVVNWKNVAENLSAAKK